MGDSGCGASGFHRCGRDHCVYLLPDCLLARCRLAAWTRPVLEDSARSLGLNPRQVFFRVILPQLRPALLGGLLLVALDALVEFDAFVALRFQTFSLDIYAQYRLGFSASGAAALSFFSIVLCLVLLFGEARLRGNANYTRVGRALAGPRPATSWPLDVAGARAAWPRWSRSASASRSACSSTGSRKAAGGAFRARRETCGISGRRAARRSCSARRRRWSRWSSPCRLPCSRCGNGGGSSRVLERSTYLSYALPDLVGAIALSYAASHYARFLYGSFALLVVAEAILFLPFAVVAMRATLGQIEPALEDSARSLGAGPLAKLWRVTLPLARPGLLAAAVLVFAFSLGDLSTAQVLLPLEALHAGHRVPGQQRPVAFAARRRSPAC